MKVLHIFNEIKYSGAELMYANAAPLFQENGIEMFAISTGKNIGDFSKVFIEFNIKTYHFPLKISLSKRISYYLKFYKFIKDNHIDLLHIHRNDIYNLGLIAKFAGVPTVKTVHNVFKNRYLTKPYAILQRWLGRNFFNIHFQTIGQSVYENELLYYKNPSTKINNWFDDVKFYPSCPIEKLEIIKKLKMNQNSFKIVSVGGCSKIKNHVDIIRALGNLYKDFKIEYFHLGSGHTECEEKELAKELGVEHLVHFLGNKDNVRDYLVASDIYIMPSLFEGLGNACLEAMACGLPSILYNSPGLRDLIENNENGYLIKKDFNQISEKIIEYYNRPELIKSKGKKAEKFVIKNFSMKNNVVEMMNFYRSISN